MSALWEGDSRLETAPQQPRQQQGLLSQRGCRGRSSLCDATLPAQQRCGVQCSSPRWRRLCCRRLPSHHAQPPNSIHKAAARWGCRHSQHLLWEWPRRPWRQVASAIATAERCSRQEIRQHSKHVRQVSLGLPLCVAFHGTVVVWPRWVHVPLSTVAWPGHTVTRRLEVG